MANKRFIDFPIATTVGDNDIILIWQSGANKQTTKATILSGVPDSLNDLTDVTISGLTNGQILRYDSVSGQWENTDQGNLDLNDLNDVTIVSPTNGQVLVYNSSTSKWENSSGGYVPYVGAVTTVNLGAQTIQAGSFVKQGGTSSQFLKANGSVDSTAYGTGSVTSVGLTMPAAFNVANSPITTAGTLAVTGAGTVAQYIRGDGSLADFPESSGGGSSVSYYLNGSVNQGTIGGVAYKELSKVPILGAGTDFTINANGYIASFITDAGDPNLLEIPGGNWNFETYFSASSGGGSPTFYVELYKVNAGGTATLIASSSSAPELIAFGTNLTPYFSSLAVPTTTLALTDRLAVRYYVTHSGRTITLHTENNHLCQIITTFTTGLTALNGLTAQVQNFAVGTTGTDFNIASAVSTHTFNLPTASATNRGALSTSDWSMFNAKENAITAWTTAQYFRGDKTFQTLNTAAVPELTNLYYTDARSRAALSFAAGSGAYNTSTGVITIPTNNNQIANGAGYITSAALAGYLPLTGGTLTGPLGGTSISLSGNLQLGTLTGGTSTSTPNNINLNSTFSNTAGSNLKLILFDNTSSAIYGIGVSDSQMDFSVPIGSRYRFYNGTFTINNLAGSGTRMVVTDSNGLLSTQTIPLGTVTSVTASSPLASSGGTTPNITIQQASGSQNGFLSSTDWTTFNNKQNALTNPVTGTGTTNYLPKFTGSTTIGNSQIFDNGTNVGIGTASPSRRLTISEGTGLNTNAYMSFNNASERWVIGNEGALPGGTNDFFFFADTQYRMVIKQGGNVLIGATTDNGARLQVSGEGRFTNSDGADLIRYAATGVNTNFATKIVSGANDVLVFRRQHSSVGALDIMSLGFNGNVGIGVSPSTRLEVTSNSSGSTEVQRWSYDQGNVGYSLRLKQDVSSGLVKHIFDVVNNSTTYANNLVLTNGKVGIKQISPLAPLHVASESSADDANVQRWDYDGSTAYQLILKQTVTSGVVRWNFSQINSNTTYNNVLVLDRGNVGIGTTSPGSYRLNVDTSAAQGIQLNGTGIGGSWMLWSNNGSANGYITSAYHAFTSGSATDFAIRAENNLVLGTGANTRMTITSGGNVGIGTPSPLTRLDCQIATTGTLTENAAFRDSSTNGNALQIWNGNNEARLRAVYYGTPSNQSITFWTIRDNGSQGERMRIDHIGNILFKGQSTTTNAESIFQNINSALNFFATQTISFSKDIGFFSSTTAAHERLRITAGGNILMSAFSAGNVIIGTTSDSGDRLRVTGGNGITFTDAIMTYNPNNDNRSGIAWRLGGVSIASITPNRRLRVNVGGVEYYIGAVEV